MIVKAIYKDKNFNYFRDTETKEKRVFGSVFECNDELAKQRIEKGLVKEASKKEKEEYLRIMMIHSEKEDSIVESNINKKESETSIQNSDTDKKADQKIKKLEDCTIEELKEIAVNENVEVTEEATKEELIEAINKVCIERAE